jgi:hypothetical protein
LKKIRFIHIPKTAGTSFTDCLSRIYKGNNKFIFYGDLSNDLERYKNLPVLARQKIVLFGGHAPRIIGEREIDTLPTIAFLRNPVSRVMSFCQHVSEGKSSHLLKTFPPQNFDLDKFLNSGNLELSNLQTKVLLGQKNYNLPTADSNSLVKMAIDVLRNDLEGFGITEYFDESLMLFQYKFGWTWPSYMRLNEKNKFKSLEFERKHIDKIRELNALDIRVYDLALQFFLQEIKNQSDYINKYLYKVRVLQKSFHLRYQLSLLKKHVFEFLYMKEH